MNSLSTNPEDDGRYHALRESEELFSKSFWLSPDCMAIVRLPDRIVIQANDALCQIWGCTPDEVLGKPTREYVSWPDEESRLAFMHELEVKGECLDQQHPLVLADGRIREFNLSSRLITFRGDSCVLSVMRDITDRKRAEIAAAHLAAIVESSDDAIVGKDLSGIVTSWNAGAEKVFGYSSSEMVGQSITRLIPQDRDQEETEILDHVRRGDKISHFETKRVRKDGRLIDVSVTTSPIKDTAGKIIGASKVARDITEHKQAEEEIRLLNAELESRVIERTAQLEKANQELEAFSYSVSHDLRAPLRAVDGFAQAVIEDYAPLLPDEGRRYLQIIRQGAQQMGMLIDDLLTFSRLSRIPLTTRAVNSSQLARSVLEELVSHEPARRLDLQIAELPNCEGDPTLLRQVWVNLLSNALKYSRKRDPAVVEIGSDTTEEGTIFWVRDNGTGFDMRYAEKLFGVFQRLHLAEDYEGTGVGLAIVQRVIHRHGGRIWAEAAVDQGATFYFTLTSLNRS